MKKNHRTAWSHPKDPVGKAEFNGCVRKISFVSERIANREGEKYNHRACKCTSCKQWHLTSKEMK